MRKAKREIKVKYLKLGRQNAWGMATRSFVEIDPILKGKKHLEILNHELLHVIFPQLEEKEVERASILLTNTLWNEHYRRIDNSNKEPLQDGKK